MTRRRPRLVAALAVTVALLGVTWSASARPVAADDAVAGHADHGHDGHGRADGDRLDPVELRQDMRKLWEDHITWTRLFIVAAEAGAPDTAATAARLLANQDDIGAAIAGFYGDAAGARLTELLREHILVAADLVHAAVVHDADAVASSRDAWYANADTIAAFLATANPRSWPLATMRSMMRTHLDQTLAEATHHLTGDYAADIADYDAIHTHILAMADALADGIVRQFPERFHR